MMRILFIGDGERDAVTLPTLVGKILNIAIAEESRPWARLHGAGRGYAKKLKFALLVAEKGANDGLVAVIDQDGDTARIKLLISERQRLRENGERFPIALGEAIPHGEVWLLDDPKAVRDVLHLPSTQAISSVTKIGSPKNVLESLLETSHRKSDSTRHVWADIAEAVDISRYQHPDATGFRAFEDDVKKELGPIVLKSG